MFVFLPLLYLWARDPLHYPLRMRSPILALFFLTTLAPATGTSSFVDNVAVADDAQSWGSDSPLEGDEGSLGSARPRMREGTRISSTMGKFYRNGRRWVFEFSMPVESDDASGESSQQTTREVREVSTTTTDRLTSKTLTVTERSESTSVTASEPGPDSIPVDRKEEVVRLRVLENLALQRVVAAISEDSNDVHWTVTGTVTEFGNENWLLLSTILRSPSGNAE